MFDNFEYFGNFDDDLIDDDCNDGDLMLKIVSALNVSSVRQSVTTLGIELQLQLKNILIKIFFY